MAGLSKHLPTSQPTPIVKVSNYGHGPFYLCGYIEQLTNIPPGGAHAVTLENPAAVN